MEFLVIQVIVLVLVGVGWYAKNLSEQSLILDDDDPIPLPSVDAILNDHDARERLRAEITGIGYLNTADRKLEQYRRRNSNAAFVYSEIFVIRRDGMPQTLHTRRRHETEIQDIEGEALAQRLADALGMTLEVM